jgi:hypothetical protein
MSSPTVRSKKLMEKEHYTVAIVEKWNPHAKIRQDLFGFLDLLCVKDSDDRRGVVGVQTTSASNMASRRKKIREHINYLAVEGAGIRIELHGWEKKGRFWECKREVLNP